MSILELKKTAGRRSKIALLEIKRTPEGRTLARRKDGMPLTPEDREEAKKLALELAPTCWNCGAATTRRDIACEVNSETPGPIPDLPRAWIVEEIRAEAGTLRAVLICSALLEDHLWLILDRSFVPTDGLACYYAEEIPLLKDKTPEELREIHKVKLAFPGCRVIQEGPEK